MKEVKTICPRNCYSSCSFKVLVDKNKIIRIDPDDSNKATPEGVCLKGLSYIERAHSDQRILYPLKKCRDSFVRITWDESLDTISKKLRHYKKEYGCKSVLYYAASGMAGLLNASGMNFWKLFGGATTVYGNLCWPAGLEATRLTLGENKHNVAWDIENSDLIILWGKNPAETNIQQMIPIEKAQSKGARLVVIDPRRTPSAERANLVLQPVPGTDAALARSVAKILMDNDHIDNLFISKHTLGFEEFKASIRQIDIEVYSLECGVPVHLIRKLASWIAVSERMTIVPGYGMQRYSNGGQTLRCLLMIQVLSGNIGKAGSCWHYADLQSDIFSRIKEPESYYPTGNNDEIFRRTISTALLGEHMLGLKDPEIKMAWVERGNPLCQNPDSNRVKKAFQKLDFCVVVDQFLTDTAMEADIVLPAKNMFEQSDIVFSYWHPYLQLKPQILQPAGEVKPENEVYTLLAKKLGISESEIKANIPGFSNEDVETWLEKQIACFPEIELEKLKSGPVITPKLQEIAFSDFEFKTPSGKIEIFSQQAKDMWGVNPLPVYEKVHEGLNGKEKHFQYQLLTPNTKNRIHSQFGNLETIKTITDEPFALINHDDAGKSGIQSNDLIRVYNHRGELIIRAKTDASLRPGCIVIANGFWHQENACANSLSLGRETDMGYGAAFHDNLVDYQKWTKEL